ncbi:MAG: (E)-4-hydroxy-3-methylbut-2-enyl-diphosphate synthase [Flammeovirgaceae bacterium]|nr:MAG: (E)-4-hydroxy-3-methylbut-2-enyl-diphosphate synthase [Flammeovirgaceae bacterium]
MVNPIVAATRQYCNSLVRYSRRKTIEVKIGDVPLGADNPIRIQSMTTVDTMDTIGSVEQVIRMVNAGCEYVRITAPSIKEAQNLQEIKNELKRRGCQVPLIADIHFTPNAAELAARIVEKVRINPGNYADKKRFETIDYTEAAYQAELDRIREKFAPLVKICKEYGTAMRIGTNHGSLSDRIMSRYGDTPLGMVESALEFLRICEDLNYYNIVLSMKASNPQVMVQAYRLLVNKLDEEGFKPYPLHLGVTEAGEGEDGRIKSAVGIGTLLEDGLGDTVRVSLTEEPEFEAPVAKIMVDRYVSRTNHQLIPEIADSPIDPFSYSRRVTREVENMGGPHHVPRVVADLSALPVTDYKDLRCIGHFYLPEPDKWKMNDQGADYVYTGKNPISFMLPNGLKEIRDYEVWRTADDKENKFPLLTVTEYLNQKEQHARMNFVCFSIGDLNEIFLEKVREDKTAVGVIYSNNNHAMAELRRIFFELAERNIDIPIIIQRAYPEIEPDQFRIYSATDAGGLFIDGFGDGLMLSLAGSSDKELYLRQTDVCNKTAFGILQATRNRMSKTEYISCPSCGRTLFDLQSTTAMIRKRTDHLKGVKIGIMGCIVNGPGEMADADYGYVGSGPARITLYRGKEVVKRNVPSAQAVDELINLIKEDGNWINPETIEQLTNE